jgi:RNA polymerase sigma factor (TIGR02999 family)
MSSSEQPDITDMLLAWSQGDEASLQKLLPLVYEDLRRMARRYMNGERSGHTLQTTALVHEAYERLVDTPRVHWRDRAHFLAVCAQLMRRVLVDYSRSRSYLKRGGGAPVAVLDEALQLPAGRFRDLAAIDDALNDLEKFDRRKSQVVELKFFGGLTVEETAIFLKVSPETVMRDWKAAKAWMLRYLAGGAPDTAPQLSLSAENAHGR